MRENRESQGAGPTTGSVSGSSSTWFAVRQGPAPGEGCGGLLRCRRGLGVPHSRRSRVYAPDTRNRCRRSTSRNGTGAGSSTAGCRRTGDGRPADHGPPRCTHRCAAKRTASHVHGQTVRRCLVRECMFQHFRRSESGRTFSSTRTAAPLKWSDRRSVVSCCWHAGAVSSSELVQAPECRASRRPAMRPGRISAMAR